MNDTSAGLFSFIIKQTGFHQLKILLIVLISFPFYFVSLDIPKQIISNAIQGKIFPTHDSLARTFVFSITPPYWTGIGHIDIFEGVDLDRFQYLFALSGLFLLLVLINGYFKYTINIRKGALGERFVQTLRLNLFSRLLLVSSDALRHLKPSEAATMLKDEVEPIGGFVGDAFVQPLFLGGQAATALLFIVLQSPPLGGIAIVILVLQLAVIPRLRREQMRLGIERQRKQRAFAGKVGEVVECLHEIRNQRGAEFERQAVAVRLEDLYHVRFRLFERKFAVKFLNNLLAQITPFLFYTIGGYFALRGSIDIGQLVAVIAAYRDLPPPLKELIDWDQQRLDVETKFQIVSEHLPAGDFEGMEKTDDFERLSHALDYPNITLEQLVVANASGDRLLEGLSLAILFGQHVAVIDRGGDGARTLGHVLGGYVSPQSGVAAISGIELGRIPNERLGRLIGYVDGNPVVFDGTLYENIVYALHRHGPGGTAGDADLIDYRAAGVDTAAAFDERLIAVLKIAGLDATVFGMGLSSRLDLDNHQVFAKRVVLIRRKLQEKIAAAGAASVIEAFDPERYTDNATIGENIVFGLPRRADLVGAGLAEEPTVRALLDRHALSEPLVAIGLRIATSMLELFKDIDEDNVLFEKFAFVPATAFPHYREILLRFENGALSEDDRTRLIGLAFLYIEPRHRLTLLDAPLKEKILLLRAAFRREADATLQNTIDFYDPDAYCPSASLRENLLFGLIEAGAAAGADRALAALTETVEEEGLVNTVYRLGLDQPAGYGGRLLYPSTKTALVIARNLIKKPSILVFNEAFSALSESEANNILRKVRIDTMGRTLIVIGRKIDMQWPFDRMIALSGTRIEAATGLADAKAGGEPAIPDSELDLNDNPELQALRAVTLFSGLDLANLKLLAFTSERVKFAEGEILFSEGDDANVAYAIVSGTAAVSVATAHGPVTITSVGAREIVGEMGIISGEPRSATITATSEMVTLRINKDIFLSLLSEFPAMALSVTRLMMKRLQDNVTAVKRHEEQEALR